MNEILDNLGELEDLCNEKKLDIEIKRYPIVFANYHVVIYDGDTFDSHTVFEFEFDFGFNFIEDLNKKIYRAIEAIKNYVQIEDDNEEQSE